MATQQVNKDRLRAQFVGKTLHNVVTPSVVLDLAKIEANCNLMLEAVRRLDLGWRAHIKTHKTTELTRLQVGDDDTLPANITVSTVLEAENILPLLKEYQENGRQVNVLFAFPLYGSVVDRLAQVLAQLGPGGLTVMVDHKDQVKHLTALASKSGNRPLVFMKVDMGSGRAGVSPESPECRALAEQLFLSETVGSCVFHGLYCHAGHSYSARTDWEAMDILGTEFLSLQRVAKTLRYGAKGDGSDLGRHPPLVLSVGATPTATSLQHPDFAEEHTSMYQQEAESVQEASSGSGSNNESYQPHPKTSNIQTIIRNLRASGHPLEIHAGVYPTLDLQQLATHSRDASFLNPSAVGITVLAEVASVYPGRGGDAADEALINAGTLALGREPCEDKGQIKGRHYGGWGLITPWNTAGNPMPGRGFPARHGGWQVKKISQEHGILRWMGWPEEEEEEYRGQKKLNGHYGGWDGGSSNSSSSGGETIIKSGNKGPVRLHVGQRIRVWPNHSCIAGAGHGHYLVVDSRNHGREDEIVDVWQRWTGW